MLFRRENAEHPTSNIECRNSRMGGHFHQSGSVLILAVWTVLFLSALAVAVGSHVSANLSLARSLAGRSAAYYIARAGVESAIAEISRDTNSWHAFTESWRESAQKFGDVSIAGGCFSVFHVETEPDGTVVTNYGVADEEGRINVNSATNDAGRELIRSLIETAGGVGRQRAVEIAACVADWIDKDEEPMENGAEGSYYEGLNPAYSCHNGAIDCLEELLLVKGVDSVLFSKIEKHLIIYGSHGSINLNTAGPVVLTSLAGAQGGADRHVCEAAARRILDRRRDGVVFTRAEKSVIRDLLYGSGGRMTAEENEGWHALEWAIGHGMVTVQSRHFSGMSTGGLPSGAAGERRIAFVYDREADEIRAWNEN